MNTKGQWDIFCKVIDNYGDVGVCWRLCCDLAGRGQAVRLWIDDASALRWMAPTGCPGVEVSAWPEADHDLLNTCRRLENLDFYVIIEAFGCEISPEFIANYVANTSTIGVKNFSWINLEYISAEKYAEYNHQLPSPVLVGPAKGLTKHFFYPGFTPATGGLLRESGLLERQTRFAGAPWPSWLPVSALPALQASASRAQARPHNAEQWISLFCYEPAGLGQLLAQLVAGPRFTHLLVTHGRAQRAVQACVAVQWPGKPGNDAGSPMTRLNQASDDNLSAVEGTPASITWGSLHICYLPPLAQIQYDELLWACDVNFVRGEDSLVRALWAGKPFVWQIYPQDDGAHHAKLEAFLRFLRGSDSMAAFHRAWNQSVGGKPRPFVTPLPALDLAAWGGIARQAREHLLQQPDLTTQLMQFVTSLESGPPGAVRHALSGIMAP